MKKLLAMVALAGIAGCGVSVTEGTVVDKYYAEPYTWYLTTSMPCGPNCSMPIITPVYEPEHYVITLENCDQRDDGDDACPQDRYNVDPGTYEQLNLGDFFDASPDQ